MEGDQELLDYVAGLEAALRDAAQMVWLVVHKAGGVVHIGLDELMEFSPETCTLERVDDRGSVIFNAKKDEPAVADA